MTTQVPLKQAHEAWLKSLVIADKYQGRWATHDFFAENTKSWTHFTAFDSEGTARIWRFTSKPDTEAIRISGSVDIGTIIDVIGRHSGGNDKTNDDVRTSSFCRNIGAMLGTAASTGGDKNVLRIINSAEYLCGLDIGTLADHGISAHPALCRMISLFETEYVLVSTPGNAARSLADLATVKYPNPFKGLIQENGMVTGYEGKLTITSAGWLTAGDREEVVPEKLATAGTMPGDEVQQILNFAVKACAAANNQPGIVQEKEIPTPQAVTNAMTKYVGEVAWS